MLRFFEQVANLGMYVVMILINDYAPKSLRRRRLEGEGYSGALLEARLNESLFDRTTIPVLWHMSAINMYPKLKVGDAVPSVVLRFRDGSDTPLAALARLAAFGETVQEFKGRADFKMVYIEEAHPTDGWKFASVKESIAQHKTMDERMASASTLRGYLPAAGLAEVDVVVDRIAGGANELFGAVPERLAIVTVETAGAAPRLHWLGGKGPEAYSVPKMREALTALLGGGK